MKKNIFIFSLFIMTFFCNPAAAKFPIHLGGFTLGDDISNYSHLIEMETCQAVAFNQYLSEGQTIPRPEFKSGLITYGHCDKPNKILRIKLKFKDSSKKFFNQLLKQYKKKLGDPSEYKGDPFQTMIAWKWSFTNNKNERISLILQNNLMVEDEKIGNAVKLTLSSQIERERLCYLNKTPKDKKMVKKSNLNKDQLWRLYTPHE